MRKRIQIALAEEAWSAVDTLTRETNEGFEGGSVNFSDVINEMILNAKIDVKALQLKHTDLRKSLLALARKADVDVETVQKCINELRGRSKRKGTLVLQEEGV